MKYCKDCRKLMIDKRRLRCRKCYVKFNVGKNASNFRGGMPKCIDCGKKLSRKNAERCQECYHKYYKGEKHWEFKGGFPKCIDCGKELSTYKVKRCCSCSKKELWKQKWYVELQKMSRQIVPNKMEKKLGRFLNKLLPNEYKFVGDFSFTIDGLCPDFINCNGQKKIIELFGVYWHSSNKSKKRDKRKISIYKKYNYNTLVILDTELRNLNKLKDKVLKFNKKGG